MRKDYDVVVIGAGAAGVFMAYEFVTLKTNAKVCMIDSGKPISKRICPIDGKKIKSCVGCKPCSIMHGFGGAGGLSDGNTTSRTASAATSISTSAQKRLSSLWSMSTA